MRQRAEGIDSTTSSVKHTKHVARLEILHYALEGKRALLEMWEARIDDKDFDHDYVVGLRTRVRSLRTRFAAMRPGKDFP